MEKIYEGIPIKKIQVIITRFCEPIMLCLIMVIGMIGPQIAHAQSWITKGTAGFSGGPMTYPAIAIDPAGTPYVVYGDSSLDEKATVKKFNGSSWTTVGIPGFSASVAYYTNIAIDKSGTPYVVYSDQSTTPTNLATVMKFDGTSWVNVGSPGFSAGRVYYTSIALDTSGIPYVCYADTANGTGATVMKYNGSTWEYVGSPDFSLGNVLNTTIVFDLANTPYVAYTAGNSKINVMKFTSGSWVYVGLPGFSRYFVEWPSIAIDAMGTPYVAYSDFYYGKYATVEKYNGSSWEYVGTPGFSPGLAEGYNWIAIDKCGTPYVAFEDDAHGRYASAMKYDGTSWVNAGSPAFSSGKVTYPSVSVTIDKNGNPYVLYGDATDSGRTTVMELLPASITGPATLCLGDSVLLTDTSGAGLWTSSNAGIVSITSGLAKGIADGIDTISYITGCQTTTITLTVTPHPDADSIRGNAIICEGDTARYTDTASGGAWSIAHTGIATISGSGLVTSIALGTDTIRYIVTGTCAADTAYFVFTVKPVASCPNYVQQLPVPGSSLSLYPNPNTGTFTLTLSSGSDEEATIVITNVLGEKMAEIQTITNKETEVTLMRSSPGIYFINAATKTGVLQQKMFTVQ